MISKRETKVTKHTPCDPVKLIMGASRLLVRFTVRMRACWRSSFEDEMAIWLVGPGEDSRVLLMRVPGGNGEAARLDIFLY